MDVGSVAGYPALTPHPTPHLTLFPPTGLYATPHPCIPRSTIPPGCWFCPTFATFYPHVPLPHTHVYPFVPFVAQFPHLTAHAYLYHRDSARRTHDTRFATRTLLPRPGVCTRFPRTLPRQHGPHARVAYSGRRARCHGATTRHLYLHATPLPRYPRCLLVLPCTTITVLVCTDLVLVYTVTFGPTVTPLDVCCVPHTFKHTLHPRFTPHCLPFALPHPHYPHPPPYRHRLRCPTLFVAPAFTTRTPIAEFPRFHLPTPHVCTTHTRLYPIITSLVPLRCARISRAGTHWLLHFFPYVWFTSSSALPCYIPQLVLRLPTLVC